MYFTRAGPGWGFMASGWLREKNKKSKRGSQRAINNNLSSSPHHITLHHTSYMYHAHAHAHALTGR